MSSHYVRKRLIIVPDDISNAEHDGGPETCGNNNHETHPLAESFELSDKRNPLVLLYRARAPDQTTDRSTAVSKYAGDDDAGPLAHIDYRTSRKSCNPQQREGMDVDKESKSVVQDVQ